MHCWCYDRMFRCQRCKAAADKKNLNLQIALLEDSLTFLEEIVKHTTVLKQCEVWSTHHYE